MMIKVFNSRFENSLRLILMLNCYGEAKDLDSLYITDFITVYGKDFGISKENLNGDNDFKYSEFQSRKVACRNALKELVLNGLALPLKEKDGILYCITEAGREFAENAVLRRASVDALGVPYIRIAPTCVYSCDYLCRIRNL